MPKFVRLQSLSLFFFGLFVLTVVAQSVAGLHEYNEEATQHGQPEYSYGRYLYSSEFGSAVLENWQSEWLQFCLFVLATVWLLQQGSPESKKPEEAGLEGDDMQKLGEHTVQGSPLWARVGGLRTRIYENSLLIAFTLIFIGSWAGQAVTSWTEYNHQQVDHDDTRVDFSTYLTRPDFWEKTLQNWQSEFLAVGTMVVFSIYLRQRGSPESKPVGEPHETTGSTG